MSKKMFFSVASAIIIFALCFPMISCLAGLLFISQNVNSLITVLLGILCGIIISFYRPIITDSFNFIFHLFLK